VKPKYTVDRILNTAVYLSCVDTRQNRHGKVNDGKPRLPCVILE
jgi:hypothetical protein